MTLGATKVYTDHSITTNETTQQNNCKTTNGKMPQMNGNNGPHANLILQQWQSFSEICGSSSGVLLDRDEIDLAAVEAVAKSRIEVRFQNIDAADKELQSSIDVLSLRLEKGEALYGISTGFGGSANLRTGDTHALQRSLLQMQHSGITPVIRRAAPGEPRLLASETCMPSSWVRGAMLIRCKSLLRGYSAVRMDIIQSILALLNNDMIPLVPLRGSISASGDLQPLSYLAGAIEGNPAVYLWADDGNGGREIIAADAALARLKLQPIDFGPKEGLAVLNGTAISTAVGALALRETHHLALLTQILTAMSVEALAGLADSFDPIFAKVRPHPGQTEVAMNIQHFLRGSKLALFNRDGERDKGGLKQDRYSIRTASQWIGPQLEDLLLAHAQISTECNSVTDNPLIDARTDTIHNGGNFQAVSVTSAMEKSRMALQMFGRILFSQCTELINPATNNGLPPNLAADDPSTSYTMKGLDISVAAYASELGFLANPVSSHVHTAEMGNQAINSLALISARYTYTAIETFSMLSASYLVLNAKFLETVDEAVAAITVQMFGGAFLSSSELNDLSTELAVEVTQQFAATIAMDVPARFPSMAQAVQPTLIAFLATRTAFTAPIDMLFLIRQWSGRISEVLRENFVRCRQEYFDRTDATPYLGAASCRIYRYVREGLKVPFHHGLIDHPRVGKNTKETTGMYVSMIYAAMRDGRFWEPLIECLGGA